MRSILNLWSWLDLYLNSRTCSLMLNLIVLILTCMWIQGSQIWSWISVLIFTTCKEILDCLNLIACREVCDVWSTCSFLLLIRILILSKLWESLFIVIEWKSCHKMSFFQSIKWSWNDNIRLIGTSHLYTWHIFIGLWFD